MIGLDHEFAICTGLALPAEFLRRDYRLVRRSVRQVQKERLARPRCLGPAIEPLDRLRGEPVEAFDVDKVRCHFEVIFGGILWRHLCVGRLDPVITDGNRVGFLCCEQRRRHLREAPVKPRQHAVVH